MAKNGWNEYKKLLLEAHSENKMRLTKIDDSIALLRIEVEKLKTKEKVMSTLFGLVGGGVFTAILAITQMLF